VARYKTLDVAGAYKALKDIDGVEPIVVDDELASIRVGKLRIFPDRSQLKVSIEVDK
jgi:hypothetical protein